MYDKAKLGELARERDRWEDTALQQTLAHRRERRERFLTTSSEGVERLYTPLEIADLDHQTDLGFPGEFPFTRGVHATMHRGRLWTMRMFSGFGSAEETNERFKYLLDHGQTGLSVALPLARPPPPPPTPLRLMIGLPIAQTLPVTERPLPA